MQEPRLPALPKKINQCTAAFWAQISMNVHTFTYAHAYPPAVWGVRRTRWESPWVGLSWDSWHTTLRASRSGHDSGCSSLRTSVAPSTRKPTAQTTGNPSEQSFIKMVLQRGIRLHMASVGLSDLFYEIKLYGQTKRWHVLWMLLWSLVPRH